MFGDIDFKADVVNGVCPTCAQNTILVSVTRDFFRCVTCGSDLRQHVNGKQKHPVEDFPEEAAAAAAAKGLGKLKQRSYKKGGKVK